MKPLAYILPLITIILISLYALTEINAYSFQNDTALDSANSFSFRNRTLSFGISTDSFLKVFPEFQKDNSQTFYDAVGYSLEIPFGEYGLTYTVVFEASGLFAFNLFSNCTNMEDQHLIDEILNQFTFITPSQDDEPTGDIVELYSKGNLIAAAFIGGFYNLTIRLKDD